MDRRLPARIEGEMRIVDIPGDEPRALEGAAVRQIGFVNQMG